MKSESRSSTEKFYRAFLDADAMAKWLPPNGFTGKVHHLDAKVGGTYKMSFTNFSTGHSHSFGGKYLELVPHERIRYTDQVRRSEPARRDADDDHLEESVLRNGVERRARRNPGGHSPAEACCLGWQESLTLLAKLVEAEIPD